MSNKKLVCQALEFLSCYVSMVGTRATIFFFSVAVKPARNINWNLTGLPKDEVWLHFSVQCYLSYSFCGLISSILLNMFSFLGDKPSLAMIKVISLLKVTTKRL